MAFARFNQCSPCCISCQLVVGTVNCGSAYEVDITVRAGPTSASKIIAATSVVANYSSTTVNFDSVYRNPLGNLVTLDTRGQFFPSTQSSLVVMNDVPCTGVKIFNLSTGSCCGACRTPDDSSLMVSWNDPTLSDLWGEGTYYNYPVACPDISNISHGSFSSRSGPTWTGDVPVGVFGIPCYVGVGQRHVTSELVSSIDIAMRTPFLMFRHERYSYGCCGGFECFGDCGYPDREFLISDQDYYGYFRLRCAGTLAGESPTLELRYRAVPHGNPAPTADDFAIISLSFYDLSLDSYSCVPFLFSTSVLRTGQLLIEGPAVSGVATGVIVGV